MTKPESPVSRRTFGTLSSIAATATVAGLSGCSEASEETAASVDAPRDHLINTIYQTCFVVTDLEASIKEWTEKLKIGPFLVFESFVMNDKEGAPLPFDIKIGVRSSWTPPRRAWAFRAEQSTGLRRCPLYLWRIYGICRVQRIRWWITPLYA